VEALYMEIIKIVNIFGIIMVKLLWKIQIIMILD